MRDAITDSKFLSFAKAAEEGQAARSPTAALSIVQLQAAPLRQDNHVHAPVVAEDGLSEWRSLSDWTARL